MGSHQVNPPVSLPFYKNLISTFLSQASFKLPPHPIDPQFNAHVLAVCSSQDLTSPNIPKMAISGCSAAKLFYPYHSRPVQLALAIFTSLTILIDDLGSQILPGLKSYRKNILSNLPQETTIIQTLFATISSLEEFYDAWTMDMILKSIIDFLSANALDLSLQNTNLLQPTPNTPHLIPYLRSKNGVSESFAYFIFPLSLKIPREKYLPIIPDLMQYMDGANDLMSFYKESILGEERDNVIYLMARQGGVGLESALESLKGSMLGCVGRIRGFIAMDGNEVLRVPVEGLLLGYLGYHWWEGRYKLGELGLVLDGCGREA